MKLGRKQGVTQKDWVKAWDYAKFQVATNPEFVANTKYLLSSTVKSLQKSIQGVPAIMSWSGGKDSLALQVVAELAGITQSVLVVSDELEFPSFLQDIERLRPEGLEIIERPIGYAWLRKNPGRLFPTSSSGAASWYSVIQHAGQRQFMKGREDHFLVMGRRLADGNQCGKPDENGTYSYVDQKGFRRLMPLATWTHEDIFSVLAYAGITLPRIYSSSRGFRVGTGPWPGRQVLSNRQGWEEVYAIDQSVVVRAASESIQGASEFLLEKEQ